MEEPRKERSLMTELLQFALLVAFIIIPFRLFVAQPFVVNGSSMDPTFKNGEYLVVDQLSHRFSNIDRGEVIIFKYPENPKKYFIKRVIGLPGETINVSEDKVTVKNDEHPSGFVLDEPYVVFTTSDNVSYTLRDDEYYVMGDNRAASFDSREWQALPEALIIGRPIVRLLPASKLSIFPGDHHAEQYTAHLISQ
jgi:signal peptidase I